MIQVAVSIAGPRDDPLVGYASFTRSSGKMLCGEPFVAHCDERLHDDLQWHISLEPERKMNWDAISAISEAIGVVAVVVSLLYVGRQLKQQNLESRIASTHEILEAFRDSTTRFQEHDFAVLAAKALSDGFDALDEAERIQIISVMIPYLRVWEEAYYRWSKGQLETELWLSLERVYADALAIDPNQIVWSMRRHTFHEAFRDYVDKVSIGEYRNR